MYPDCIPYCYIKPYRDVLKRLWTYSVKAGWNSFNAARGSSWGLNSNPKNSRTKSNWTVYEIEVESKQSIEDLLNEKCRGFYIDQNLIQKENQTRMEIQESIEKHIEDLKKNGIRKSKISKAITKPVEGNNQNRGFRI